MGRKHPAYWKVRSWLQSFRESCPATYRRPLPRSQRVAQHRERTRFLSVVRYALNKWCDGFLKIFEERLRRKSRLVTLKGVPFHVRNGRSDRCRCRKLNNLVAKEMEQAEVSKPF